MDEAIARYRRRDAGEEIAVYHDEEPENPLELDPWFVFLTRKNSRYRHGTEQLEVEELDARAAAARARGSEEAKVLPVYMYVHSGVAFSLGRFAHAWDSGQCGIVVLERGRCDEHGLDWSRIEETAAKVLDHYQSFVMGWCWRFRRFRLERCCSLGETHRIDVTEETDESHGRGAWHGTDPEATGILEEAGISRPGEPTRLADDWTAVQ